MEGTGGGICDAAERADDEEVERVKDGSEVTSRVSSGEGVAPKCGNGVKDGVPST